MNKIFEKRTLKNLELNNRIVMAPMCTYSSNQTGIVKNWHLIHYTTRAIGGVGLILLEATAIEPRGRISDRDLGLWNESQVDKMTELVNEVHQYGSKIGVQLAHAGRKCGVDEEKAISASSVAYSDRYQVPTAMTAKDIKTVVDAFKDAAERAELAGFDTIEIHGAHGYLINQFLSPLTNKRTDQYGGILKNRVRFLEEVLLAVKEVWPSEKPILLRLSAEEYSKEGNHIEETFEIVNLVKKYVDCINVSTGGVVSTPITPYPGYQVPFSEAIKKTCQIKTIAGGLITNYQMIEEVLQNNRADYVYLGRALLRQPYFVLEAAKSLEVDIIPKSLERGFM